MRGESHDHPRRLRFVHENDILFGNMSWVEQYTYKLKDFKGRIIIS